MIMESKELIRKIAPHTLVNYSLIKRMFADTSLKNLRADFDRAIEAGLLIVHDFPNLRCFSLSAKGFALLDIVHLPQLHFNQQEADNICRVNHFRQGFDESIASMEKLHLDKWVSASKFAKSPLFVRVRDSEQELTPAGAGIISDDDGKQKLFFIHVFVSQQELHNDINLYRLFTDRQLQVKRFFLRPETPVRVIVLTPNYKTIYQMHKHLHSTFYKQVLFLPMSHVHHDELLKYKIFMDHKTEKHAVIQDAR